MNARYAFISAAPDAPTNFTAFALSTNQVSLWWSSTLTNMKTSFTIERRTGINGDFCPITLVNQGCSYIDNGGGLTASTTYDYRIQACSYFGDSDTWVTNSVTTLSSGINMPLASTRLWLKADAGRGGGQISSWNDQSGYTNNGVTLFKVTQAVVIEQATATKLPVLRFTAANEQKYSFPDFLRTNWGAMQAFVVLKANDSGVNRGLWRFGTLANGALMPQWGLTQIDAGSYGMYIGNNDFSSSSSLLNYRLDFSVVAVPEPSTLALGFLGVLGLLAFKRRHA